MTGEVFSLILLPTLACNAACDYCFENKSQRTLSIDQLPLMFSKVMDYLEENEVPEMSIYWQGGEVMTLPPEWLDRAHDIIGEIAQSRGKEVSHFLQSNMIAYGKKWNSLLSKMFGNSVGSSMDFPNLYRKLKRGGRPEEYEKIWTRNIMEAINSGIHVGTISIANEQTFELGAERFYSYFVEELGIWDFQINTPFPGGSGNEVKDGFCRDIDRLTQFFLDLADIWMERGFQKSVRVGPFDKLMDYFIHGNRSLLCIWRENCARDFMCIDPAGNVAQCDCWVTSYPQYRYGNILRSGSLDDLLMESSARRSFQKRPGILAQTQGCIECDYLHLCHGGCPVRTYTFHGDLMKKDPYCELYRRLFSAVENHAANYLRIA